jgi:hypothetical protein
MDRMMKKKFILNAIMNGWKVKKRNDNCYVFKKNKKYVYNYNSPLLLKQFIQKNLIN